MYIATVIIGALLAAVFFAAGIPKVLGTNRSVAASLRLNIALPTYRVVGGLEILGAAGVLVGLVLWWLGVAAATGLTLMMVGAVVALLRVGESAKMTVPAFACAALAVSYIVLSIVSA